MGKKTVFTNITPLPQNVSREVAIAMLHNHDEMIELNPLVIEHHPVKTPRDAPKDEFLDCAWHEMTDRISYLPGGIVKGKVTYKGCFHNLPNGLQTHIYAPMSLDIREKWTVCGTLPGEPEEARELGVNVPRRGLYLREDGEMKCNMLMSSFVRKNLDNSHKVLVERILAKAERIQAQINYNSSPSETSSLRSGSNNIPAFQPGSHMGNSNLVRQMSNTPNASPIDGLVRPQTSRTSTDSAAVRTVRSQLSGRDQHSVISELPASQRDNMEGSIQPNTLADGDPEEIRTVHPALREQYRQNLAHTATKGNPTSSKPPPTGKSFAVELEGSSPEDYNTSRPGSRGIGTDRSHEPVEMDGGFMGYQQNPIYPSTLRTEGIVEYPRDGSTSELTTPVMDREAMPSGLKLAHMRSYSQPLIEADTYINSASSAHNMESSSRNISAHPTVGGTGGFVPQSRFRGLSNSAASGVTMESRNNNDYDQGYQHDPISYNNYDNMSSTDSRSIDQRLPYPQVEQQHQHQSQNSSNNNNNNTLDRYSVVSQINDLTPRAGQYEFGTGEVDNRYSVVSDITDGPPTPRAPAYNSAYMTQQMQFHQQQQQQQHQRQIEIQREREREMQRRNFI